MHKHPTPAEIKQHIVTALIMAADNIDSTTLSKVYDAVDTGIRAANTAHDKKKEAINA